MRVLVITQFAIPHAGGLSAHVQDLIESLRTEGIDFRLIEGKSIARSRLRRLYSRLKYIGRYDLYRIRLLNGSIERLKQATIGALREDRFDLIHCHDPGASYSTHSALSRTNKKMPVIQTVHGPYTYESRMTLGKEIEQSDYLKRLWEIEKESYQNATRIIAVDTGQKRIVTEDFEISADKVTIIPNAVSCDSIKIILKTPSSYKVPLPYLLVPRRLVQKTGVHVAVQALKELSTDIDISIVIAGDGPLRGELEQLAAKLNVNSRVVFLGAISRDEVLRLAKNALAVMVPSVPVAGVVEATSIAALEAMACGTVVIASNIGGLAEIINDKQTGFLVPHSDPKAIASVVERLYEDPQLWKTVSRTGYEHVLNNFDRSIWFSKILEIYRSVSSNKQFFKR